MKCLFNWRRLSLIMTSLMIFLASCDTNSTGNTVEPLPEKITITESCFHPEGVVYNEANELFYVGSYNKGKVVTIDMDGNSELFAEEAGFVSVVGLAIDTKNNRLAVVNADLGLAVKSSDATTAQLAEVYIYDLSDASLLHRVDLSGLITGGHFTNDVIADNAGNFYVTNSFTPAIYKIASDGSASVLLIDNAFAPSPDNIGLNGLVYHPDGYLIAGKTDGAKLFKIPVSDPASFSEVTLNQSVNAIDGLLLKGNDLILVSNNFMGLPYAETVYRLNSTDDWGSATVSASFTDLEGTFPTTATEVKDEAYVIFGHFPELAMGSTVAAFNIQKIQF
jgi:sugar lactone lactonase YvrE